MQQCCILKKKIYLCINFKNMKKIICFLLLVSSYSSFGQSYVDRVIVFNEGYFDYTANQIVVPPTIGFYDPVTQVYSVIDTLFGARFASDIILSGLFCVPR